MIRLAGSKRLKDLMQSSTATSELATRYVGGASPGQAVEIAHDLHGRQIRSSLFYLGEYVETLQLVRENVDNKLAAIDALRKSPLDIHISVDPTQIGFSIDRAVARENARVIADRIGVAAGTRPGVHCLMLDMEDRSVTTATIELHDELHEAAYPVALTLQAYLKRTVADMRRMIDRGGRVRLVRGAFAADPSIAHTKLPDIKAAYLDLARLMLSSDAKRRRFYPIFGTHDDVLHEQIVAIARDRGWQQGEYEFEMLHGARTDVSDRLACAGERIRLYLPFGTDWWPYAVRRIGENPRNAYLLAKALFQRR